ncbi:MAG: hypothetical protein ACK55Z_00470, partial [bacterium]
RVSRRLRSTVSCNRVLASCCRKRTLIHHSFRDSSILARRCSALCCRSYCLACILAGDSLRTLLISFLCTSS